MSVIVSEPPVAAESFPLSAQQAFLLGREREAGRPLLAGILLDLPAGCGPDRVRQAVLALSTRHEVLRTRYVRVTGLRLPLQSVRPEPEIAFATLERDEDVAVLLEAARPRLGRDGGPLLDATHLRGAGGTDRLFLAGSLCSLDRHSLALLAQDLEALLAGRAAGRDEALQYADYALWQAELLESEAGRQGRVFWCQLIEGCRVRPPLPFERPGGTGPARRTALWSDGLPARLADAAGDLGTSTDRLLLFLWTAFVGRLLGVQELLGGLAVDGRSQEVAETAGPFARVLPVAADLRPELSLRAGWQGFQNSLERSLLWQDCLSEPDLADGEGRLPLACALTAEADPPAGARLAVDDPGATRLDLAYREEAGRALLTISHAEGAVDPALPRLWLGQLLAFVEGAVADPDRPLAAVGMLGAGERRRLDGFSATAPLPPSPSLLHRQFEQQAEMASDRTALRVGDVTLSYGELERRANAVANWLRDRGVGPEVIVGVHAGRAVETVAAVLGVLKAGGAYLPLDPSYPPQRLAWMLADSGARHVLALDPLPAEGAAVYGLGAESPVWRASPLPVPAAAKPGNLAYVVYTSGSTGRPKGVLVSHAAATASLAARQAFYADPVEAFLLLSPFSFDSSVAGLFWTLSQGGTLVLPTDDDLRDPQRLAALLDEARVSHYLTLPSLHAQLLEALGGQRLRCAIVAGEACPPDLPRRHAARLPEAALDNEYGPTEGSVWCTAWRTDPTAGDGAVPIGRPIPGARVHILDTALEPVPIGMEGHIHLAGPGLARGYLGAPGLTAERFIPDPHDPAGGGRLYRTGDLGRWRPDGTIEYRGRIDQQVKVRGFRIEPGEVEAALARCEGVGEVAVVARDTPAGKELVGFVVAAGGAVPGLPERIRESLARTLPAFMLPARLSLLEAFPRTANGKLDRDALLALEQRSRDYAAPRTDLERTLAQVWAEALAVERVGLHDNFFELGGHSLLAARLRARIEGELGVVLPLRFFFEGQTLEEFAAKVGAYRDQRGDAIEALLAEAEAR
jgi:amino acid adenylation domain-containing protein